MSDLRNGDLAIVRWIKPNWSTLTLSAWAELHPPELGEFNTDREEVASWDPDFAFGDPHEYWAFFGSDQTARPDQVEIVNRVYLTTEEPK